MKIISYNVNGIRSALTKGLLQFMQTEKADVYCFQETKAMEENLQHEKATFEAAGYPYQYWFSAQKKGYSGVALFCKKKPDLVTFGFNDEEHDKEGRIIRADFGDISVISVYIPSGTTGDVRQSYKMSFLEFFTNYITKLRWSNPNLVICGDFNIVHHPIDIHDPVGNKNSSGFLPEERAWLTDFIETGFIDSFRAFNHSPHQYSWWTFRAGARGNNKGWRIDYCMVSEALRPKLRQAGIMQEVMHSDHCPVWVEIDSQ